jgi:hypothetical protein
MSESALTDHAAGDVLPEHQSREAEVPSVRSRFFNLLDRKLDIDAAAAVIQQWSDKVQASPDPERLGKSARRWEDLPHGHRELYRLIVYRVACALAGEEVLEDDPQMIAAAVKKQSEKVAASGLAVG